MDINKLISVTQLRSEQQREIAEVIGIEAYRKLVDYYGGSRIYIEKSDTITRPDRNDEIRKKFDGGNYKQLAREYELSEETIRRIVNKK
ncbi:MAG: DNA-binding protein [Ruminococcus sp.]|nr:DNA-binding protein [Ruminococcus sp.]